MKYVILNDGETYTDIKGCAIYDSETQKVYAIRKDKEIDTYSSIENMHWEKGIQNISSDEYLKVEDNNPIVNEDDGILGK